MIAVWEYGTDPTLENVAGTHVQIFAGTSITTAEDFLDEEELYLAPYPGYPKVSIKEGSSLITSGISYAKVPNSGHWLCDLTIPEGFDFEGKVEKILNLIWEFKSSTGEVQKNTLLISVTPRELITEEDGTTEVIVMAPYNGIKIKVPYLLDESADYVSATMYEGNTALGRYNSVSVTRQGTSSIVEFGISGNQGRLTPYNLILDICLDTRINHKLFTNLYVTNPSILSAMQALDMSINKANQVEAIPGLRYRDIDLLQGLKRGLDHFNSIAPSLTSFTGENMQGPIREGWLICASIRVLRAQLGAEGWFNFDFSGQNVSLNVDRTAGLESAVNSYESLIDSLVKPLKFQLARKGVISGDGSVGDNLAFASQMGVTTLSNNAITRSKLGGGRYRY